METAAIIDCGTNTFHLLIVQLSTPVVKLHEEKQVVKIGEGGINDGKIAPIAADRALKALIHFKRKIDDYLIYEVSAVVTRAFRNAINGIELAREILKQTGIALNIISGKDEAALIYRGISKAVTVRADTTLSMDIGGGSVEFIIAREELVLWSESFEIGAQRLMDLFHKHDPILKHEVEQLQFYLLNALNSLFTACNKLKPTTLIGSSGTFDTLSEIYCRTKDIKIEEDQPETPLTLSAFYRIHKQLIEYNRAQRLALPGMIEMRVDMIVVASCIIEVLLKKIPIEDIRVSKYALKEGILAEIVDGHGLS